MTKALILAAGRGSRLLAHTVDRPKCLVEVCGRSMLDWQLEAIRKAGIAHIGIVTGWADDHFRCHDELQRFRNPDWHRTNMLRSLECASDWLGKDVVIVCYSDIIYSSREISSLVSCTADLAIVFDRDWEDLWRARFEDPLVDAENFRLGANGTVAAIGGRPSNVAEIEGQFLGLIRISPRGWQSIAAYLGTLGTGARDRIDFTSMLSGLIAGGVPVAAVPAAGPWCEVDSPTDLAVAELVVGGPGWSI